MLVEKLICNARLNLLILHPFPTPSQLPQQTEAQWPIYTEVPRNKNIYLRKGGGGLEFGWVEKGDREEKEERDRVSAHMSQTWTASGEERGGGINVLLASSHSLTQLHPLCKPLSTSTIHPFISQQTKHVTHPHPESHQLTPHTQH